MSAKHRQAAAQDRAYQAQYQAQRQLAGHALLGGLVDHAYIWPDEDHSHCPAGGGLVAQAPGTLWLHPTRMLDVACWRWLLAHGLLYFGLERFEPDRALWPQWSAACDVVIVRLLRALRVGQPPDGLHLPDDLPGWDEAQWYRHFCEHGVPDWALSLSPAGPTQPGMLPPESRAGLGPQPRWVPGHQQKGWGQRLAEGMARAVQQAVEAAGGSTGRASGPRSLSQASEQARSWFISSFPLLGAMVSSFEFIEDAELCRREEISVAAVDELARCIYLNPAAGLSADERRFVIAHEVLHVALRHLARRRGRDPYLWNVACDFVVNAWLIDMAVGTPPAIGLLHDAQLHGLSVESVYDRITSDLRRARKLATLAGRQGDMLERRIGSHGSDPATQGTDLDAFYRSLLAKGLALHEQQGRGLLPAGLVEEIRALMQPPIPWDVALARWFDRHFPPLERQRSYARPSRRQASTPDIARPRWVSDPRWLEARTFGVVLDTSGSMDRQLLAQALGAIAGYANAREVPAVRVVFCDAAAHDAGYMAADDIAGRVQVRGRGGTVLQPGIDLLQAPGADFPADGPILIITDGHCDVLSIARHHAFVLPAGRRLPFRPWGEVFYLGST